MSRIGNKVVVLPAGVEIKQDGNNITVKGPKGELTREFSSDIKMNIEGNEVTFIRPNDSKEMKTIHGTTRANFNNMVVGVSERFQKHLNLSGRIPCPSTRQQINFKRWLFSSCRNDSTRRRNI